MSKPNQGKVLLGLFLKIFRGFWLCKITKNGSSKMAEYHSTSKKFRLQLKKFENFGQVHSFHFKQKKV